jgi:CheY-like chemotaxis protein
MAHELKSFEAAITAADFSSDDFCGINYAGKVLGMTDAEVQALVERGALDAWKTLGGHTRISLQSVLAFKSPSKTAQPPLPGAPKPIRVLIVEDDEVTRDLYRHQLDEWDLPVDCTWVSSALEALMDIASMRPDLLITDLSMPGVDGIEMLRALKRNKHLANMKIIVISGLPPASIASRGGLPADAHLVPKPANFDWLQGFVTALMNAGKVG